MFKVDLGKAEEPEIKLPTFIGSQKKSKRIPEKIYFCFIDYAKPFDFVDQNKLWKILQEMGVPAPQFQSLSSLVLSLLYGPTLTSVHEY